MKGGGFTPLLLLLLIGYHTQFSYQKKFVVVRDVEHIDALSSYGMHFSFYSNRTPIDTENSHNPRLQILLAPDTLSTDPMKTNLPIVFKYTNGNQWWQKPARLVSTITLHRVVKNTHEHELTIARIEFGRKSGYLEVDITIPEYLEPGKYSIHFSNNLKDIAVTVENPYFQHTQAIAQPTSVASTDEASIDQQKNHPPSSKEHEYNHQELPSNSIGGEESQIYQGDIQAIAQPTSVASTDEATFPHFIVIHTILLNFTGPLFKIIEMLEVNINPYRDDEGPKSISDDAEEYLSAINILESLRNDHRILNNKPLSESSREDENDTTVGAQIHSNKPSYERKRSMIDNGVKDSSHLEKNVSEFFGHRPSPETRNGTPFYKRASPRMHENLNSIKELTAKLEFYIKDISDLNVQAKLQDELKQLKKPYEELMKLLSKPSFGDIFHLKVAISYLHIRMFLWPLNEVDQELSISGFKMELLKAIYPSVYSENPDSKVETILIFGEEVIVPLMTKRHDVINPLSKDVLQKINTVMIAFEMDHQLVVDASMNILWKYALLSARLDNSPIKFRKYAIRPNSQDARSSYSIKGVWDHIKARFQ